MLLFWRKKLWYKLAALFILAGILPLLGAGFLTIRALERKVKSDAERRLGSLGDISGALVRQYIRQGEEKLSTLSQLLAKEIGTYGLFAGDLSHESYRSTVIARLNSLVAPPDMYLELQYYAAGKQPELVGVAQQAILPPENNLQERIISNSMGPLVKNPLQSNQSYAAPRLESMGGPSSFPTSSQSFPASLPHLNLSALPLSTPVRVGDATVGVLVAYLDFRRISGLLETVAGGGYQVQIRDGAGQILAQAGSLEEDSLREVRPVGYSDWSVELREPAARVYASLEEIHQQAILWMALALLLAVALSAGLATRIIRPLKTLTRAAEEMEAGNLKARARLNIQDEIGLLGARFDRMAEALERLDTAKSEFVANVSHELRTPLTSIQLSIANLLEGVLGPVDPRQEKTLSRLRGDVARLIEMVNALLEMARLEAGAVALRRTTLNLRDLAREAQDTLSPLARQKDIEITIVGEGSASADPSMLRRVLLNLLDNAIKFTPQGGWVKLTIFEAGFSVSDSGPGVSLEDPFAKFSQGAQRGVKNKGAGLGLAIAKKMIELHGGSIQLMPGPGATFTVKL